jgi:hypothetical protein
MKTPPPLTATDLSNVQRERVLSHSARVWLKRNHPIIEWLPLILCTLLGVIGGFVGSAFGAMIFEEERRRMVEIAFFFWCGAAIAGGLGSLIGLRVRRSCLNAYLGAKSGVTKSGKQQDF